MKSVLFAHVPEPKKLNYLKLYNTVLQGENWVMLAEDQFVTKFKIRIRIRMQIRE